MTELLSIIYTLIKILCIVVPLMLTVAYYTYVERKIIGFMQARVGPHRVGPYGLFQPIADGLKLFLKETIIPTKSNKYLYFVAPILTLAPALAAWAVMPFSSKLVLANLNIGMLYILSMTSLAVYGVLIAGWASNSGYAFLSTMRSAAQMIAYEIPMGFALVGVLMAAQTMNLTEIVLRQQGGIGHWYFLPLFPLFIVYWISVVAETNRAPFDVAEGESEIVAGFHIEYSGIMFSIFFLAEYANMILVSFLAAIMFLGGWHSPFEGIPVLHSLLAWVPAPLWLIAKALVLMFTFLWFRATFPRYRYDQIMRLGWKVFIPITLIWVSVVAMMVKCNVGPWFAQVS